MDILLVRHGESEANAEGRLQGRLDYHLSERGRQQARQLAGWLVRNQVKWDAAYSSPLARAAETAAVLAEIAGGPAPELVDDLAEISVGRIEGMTRDEIGAREPGYLRRDITGLGDFSEYGGESYDEVQARAMRLVDGWIERFRQSESRVLVVGHGGINFQILKLLVCRPVPRVCVVRMGNCSATHVRMRERRGTYMGELVWHLPIELMGAVGSADTGALFR